MPSDQCRSKNPESSPNHISAPLAREAKRPNSPAHCARVLQLACELPGGWPNTVMQSWKGAYRILIISFSVQGDLDLCMTRHEPNTTRQSEACGDSVLARAIYEVRGPRGFRRTSRERCCASLLRDLETRPDGHHHCACSAGRSYDNPSCWWPRFAHTSQQAAEHAMEACSA